MTSKTEALARGAMVKADQALRKATAGGSGGTTTLTGDVTGSGIGTVATTIASGSITLTKQANMATASVVYRKTAGAGPPEVQTLVTLKADLGLTGTNSGDQIVPATLSATATKFVTAYDAGTGAWTTATPAFTDLSGSVAAAQMPALTGDVTTSAGSVATTIAAGAVTLAKQANMATASVVYRKTAGVGPPEVQTLATLKTDLGLTGTNTGDQTITLTGDITGSGTGSFVTTLAAVNANVGTFGSGSLVPVITVNAKGLVTGVTTAAVSGGGSTPDFIYQSTDYTLTSTTSAQKLFNQTTNGRYTFASTGLYRFKAFIWMTTMSGTSGNAMFDLKGTGTATISGQVAQVIGVDQSGGTGLAAAATRTGSGILGSNASPASMVTGGTGTEMMAEITGIIQVTATGTIIPSVSLVTAAAAVVKTGTHLIIEKVAAASTFSTAAFD